MSDSRLLVAVSSPWASQKFVGPIVDLARRLDAQILVAHVTHPQDEDEDEASATARGEETLKLLTEALRDEGVRAEPIMLFGDDVAKAILNTAKARHCTLIVLGWTGKSLWKRLFAADVPENIIRQSDLPVLLCPASWSGQV